MTYRVTAAGLVGVFLVLSALLADEARAQAPSPNLATPAELQAYREWVWSLPTNPFPPLPLPTGMTTFRWDQVEETDPNNPSATIVVDYTTPSYTQTGGTCFLFAVIGALEIRASIDSNLWWNWGSETQRGVRLSILNGWNCNHLVGSDSGFADEMLRWSQYHGIPEDCFDPYAFPLPAHGLLFEDRPPCHNCDQYLGPQATIPATCSPWQRADSQVLYYRHSGPVPVNVVGDKSRADLERLVEAIYEGPVVENTNWATGVTYDCIPGQSGMDCVDCEADRTGGGGHVITLIGFDITDTNDFLLVRNSHVTNEAPWWISYSDWAGKYDPTEPEGCGIGTASVQPGTFTMPEPIPMNDVDAPQLGDDFHHAVDNYHPYLRICELDPDGDSVHLLDDNCRNESNSDQQDDDGDGVGDVCDNCPTMPNFYQLDQDDDGIGDACEEDTDGDGVHNAHDCAPLNRYVMFDLDDDDVCEYPAGFSRFVCESECTSLAAVHQWDSAALGECNFRCDPANADNCADDVDNPVTTACQDSKNSVLSGGAPDPACMALYANPVQENSDGLGQGDRCESRVHSLVVSQQWVPTIETWALYQTCPTDLADVSFRANSANPTGARIMAGTSVEACVCQELFGAGLDEDWDDRCKDLGGVCEQTIRPPWTPIRDETAFAVGSNFPYSGTEPDPTVRNFLNGYMMGRDRDVPFERSEDNNLRQFSWSLDETVTWVDPFDPQATPDDPELFHTQADPKPLKVRVTYPDRLVGQTGDFGLDEIALSPGVRYLRRPLDCNVTVLAREYDQWWWLPNDWLSQGPFEFLQNPMANSILNVGESMYMVHYDQTLAQPTRIAQVTFQPDGQMLRNWSAAVSSRGAFQTGLAGLDYGRVITRFVYEPSASMEQPARLWIAPSSGSDENLWITAREALANSENAPALTGAHSFFDPEAQRLYLLGNEVVGEVVDDLTSETATAETNVLYTLVFEKGSWVRLGKVAALGETSGYSANFDPIRRRLILFGGRQDGQETARLLALDPNTMGVLLLSANGSSSYTVERADHGAYLDPSGHRLYVYGGTRSSGEELLSDLFVTDLTSSVTTAWTELWPSTDEGPGHLIQPMLWYDRQAKTVWVAGGSHQGETVFGPWSLSLDEGSWEQHPSLKNGRRRRHRHRWSRE